jgi:hypothetical protein
MAAAADAAAGRLPPEVIRYILWTDRSLKQNPLKKQKKLALSSLELDRRQRLNRRATILRSEKVHADASLGPLLRAPRSLAGGGGGSAGPLIQYRPRAPYQGGPRRLESKA